jgi:arylsulfatase A-like enzyme
MTRDVTRREALAALAAGSVGLSTRGFRESLGGSVSLQGQRPNVIFISADDLGYGDLSGYGRADYTTPVLDRLAAQGTRFTHAYSIAPICTPTRVGFMTGRYPARHPVGLKEPLVPADEQAGVGLPRSHPTVSSLLKASGYTNALFGKWHLGTRPEFQPDKHGFSEFFGPLGGAADYVSHTGMGGVHDLHENGKAVRVDGYLTDLLMNRAVRFIAKRPEPFFLSLQGTAPHWPWQRRGDSPVPRGKRLSDDGPADRFPDMVRALDEGVGRVLRALDDARIAARTIVIFTSDNGGERYSSMAGLAGHKGQCWEGGIRVPAFVRWPGTIPAGVTTAQVATTLDWMATILAAGRTPAAPTHPLDGEDLMPHLLTRAPRRDRTVFWRIQRTSQGAMRQGAWKYLRDGNRDLLFDLTLDPGERVDRTGTDAPRAAAMRASYAAWASAMLPLPVARQEDGPR